MAQYIIKFRGHIVEALRNEGFPRIVESDLVVDVVNAEGLRQATNSKLVGIIKNNGMIIVKKSSIEGTEFIPDTQYFVPLSNIAWIDTQTIKLAKDIPEDEKLFTN